MSNGEKFDVVCWVVLECVEFVLLWFCVDVFVVGNNCVIDGVGFKFFN